MTQVIQIVDWMQGWYLLFGFWGIVCGYVATKGMSGD